LWPERTSGCRSCARPEATAETIRAGRCRPCFVPADSVFPADNAFPADNVSDPRFYVDAPLNANSSVALPSSLAHHASHVLRLRDGAPVVLFNGRGGEYRGSLTQRGTQVVLHAHDPIERESPIRITLVQSWIATDKLEWVVEKGAELGVAGFVLCPARRSVVQLDATRRARRLERLRDTVIAACCQCGRNRLPGVEAVDDLATALAAATAAGAAGFVLHPEAPRSLAAAAPSHGPAFAVAIGPEGGFDDAEVALAHRCGYLAARLGSRVLRTETAGVAAAATLQAIAGDFR
jgi:16S rRNA (uracil1498-N3)-methyltransferase